MSEQAKHTPGPWKVNHPEIIDEHGVDVAGVNCYRDCLPEEEANSRLIAAAPDLLAACKAALDYMQHPSTTGPPSVMSRLAAAIAKAEPTEESDD